MRTSISHLKSHLECPRKAYFGHVLRRGTLWPGKALALGTILHEILAERMRGISPAIVIPPDFPLEWVAEAHKVIALAEAWEVPEGWEVCEVEKEMETAVGKHTLVGTLDSVVKWGGNFWHVQHKSLAARTPLDRYGELLRYDMHEVVYQKMADEAGYQPFAGTILNVLKKGVPKGENPYFQDYLSREGHVSYEVLRDIEELLDAIEDRGYDRLPVGNRSACMGPYKNSPCLYLRCCNGEVSIEDDAVYSDLKERYATTGEANEASAE